MDLADLERMLFSPGQWFVIPDRESRSRKPFGDTRHRYLVTRLSGPSVAALPRTTKRRSETGRSRAHPRHDDCLPSCRIDRDGYVVAWRQSFSVESLHRRYSCDEPDAELLRWAGVVGSR